MFAVIPSGATSRASVFDHPNSVRRNAFERPRLGIGVTTPEDVLVITRPHFFFFMSGRTPSVIAITDRTIDWKCLFHTSAACPDARVGGGPAVAFARRTPAPRCRL